MKRSALALTLLLLVLFTVGFSNSHAGAAAMKEAWTSIKSKNFILVGNASEKDIRKVAAKLEQFRDVFGRLFSKANLNSPVPIKVVVFKNRDAYRPFMPTYQGKVNEVAGYFMPGQDVNYITLTAELGQNDPFSTIFHEFVHSLTNDNTVRTPAWFSEGLAEFYSTFDVTDGDKKVWLGKPIAHHVYLLRENKFLPLPRLFAVDHGSPEYNERDKKGVFYAQSWALVHYLLMGAGGQRKPQFIKYLELLAQGKSVDQSFTEAFQTDYAKMEKELRDYIRSSSYPVQTFSFERKIEFDASMEATQMSEAEWNYHLGDLVLHLNRTDSESYLKKAIALDPNLAVAHASLGMAQMRAQRFDDAKKSLQTALSTGSQNHMAHYYYAYILSREGMDATNYISGYPEAAAQRMRDHLKTAIRIAPQFPESYRLLAFVNLVTNEQLDESASLIKRAMQLSPGRQDFAFMLAQIYMRQEKYDDARKLAAQLANNASEPELRARAQSLLDSIKTMSEQMARYKSQIEEAEKQANQTTGQTTSPDSTATDGKPRIALRRRFDGDKFRGMLVEVDCADKGMTLTVKEGSRTLKLHTASPERVQFLTYTPDVNQSITCGKINPAKLVIVTYRSSTDAGSPFDGEPVAVEFVKPEQK